MNKLITAIIDAFQLSGSVEKDSYNFLIKYNRQRIADHSIRVGRMAKHIAKNYGVNSELAEAAGYLHDIGGIFPNDRRVEIASALGIEILPEEKELPLILHQRISKVLARDIFQISNMEILNAVECHTTLKSKPSKLDMVLFIADKIKWDQNGSPPYLRDLESALDISLESAAFCYIDYLFKNKEKLMVLHPWLLDAYTFLGNNEFK